MPKSRRETPESFFQRLTKLFKSGPVVKRKIRTRDTQIAMPDKLTSSGLQIFQKSMNPTYATITANAYNLTERLMRYQDFCVAAETVVFTSKGLMRIDDLVELWTHGQHDIKTLSYSLSEKCLCMSDVTQAKHNGKKSVVSVTLSDRSDIRCTNDHRFLLNDGRYIEAQDLVPGSSLMTVTSTDENLIVVSVLDHGETVDVYDLSVPDTSNFAVVSLRSNCITFVHNCEMLYTSEIAAALNIYADETASCDEKGRILHIYSDNKRIKEILEDVFYGTLNIEFNIRPWTHNLCQFGDFALLNDVSPEYGILNAFPIPINEIEREENYDPEDPFAVRFRWVTLGNRILENWEVSHFRILGNDQFLPYGCSIIESARKIWRQLILIEDAMLVYRITRAPDRRVFSIDVGNTPPADVPAYLEQAKAALRTTPVTDRQQGRQDLRFNPMSISEDYFLPVRGSESGTKIETLAGGTNAAAVEDVAYIQKKLISALMVPRAYLGFEDALCLTGDTKVALLNGKDESLEDLSKLNWDKDAPDMWTYSCDPSTGKMTPGRIVNVWKTKDVSELLEVTLDDGSKIRCTENHPFLCRDGVYCRADELKPNQSLMPLYRKLSSMKERDFQNGYEKCLDNKEMEWKYTHRLILAAGLVKDDVSRLTERSYVIHHVDCDKRNNTPNNLVKMGKKSHIIYHSKGTAANLTKESSREALREVMKTEKYITALKEGTRNAWKKDDGTRSASVAESNRRNKTKNIDLEYAAAVASTCQFQKEFFLKFKEISRTGFNENLTRRGIDVPLWFKSNLNKKNHKVVSVRVVSLDNPISVYDIEVEGNHNFAVSLLDMSCVYVHNSSKSTLAQQDIRFSRTISGIQKTIIAELNKIATIHLYAHGFRDDDLLDYTLYLSNPSTIAQQQKLELIKARFDIAGSAPENMVDRKYIQTEVLGLTEDEIEKIDEGLFEDAAFTSKLEAAGGEAGEGGGGGGGGGMGGLFGDEGGGGDIGGGGEDLGGGAEEPTGGESSETGGGEEDVTAGFDAGEQDEEELLLAVDDPNDRPIRPSPEARKRHDDYNRKRRSATHHSDIDGPDFMRSLDQKNDDPFDTRHLKSVSSMKETRFLTKDMRSMLGKMSNDLYGRSPAAHGKMLIESSIDVQDEIDSVSPDDRYLFDIED